MLVTVENAVSSGLVTVKLVISYVLVTCWLVVTWPPDEGCATTSDPETQQGMHFIRFQFSNSCTVKPRGCEHLGTRAKVFTLVGFHIGGCLNKWMFTLGVHISEVLS